jgi:hypothetical protein
MCDAPGAHTFAVMGRAPSGTTRGGGDMPRYVIERTFPDGLRITQDEAGTGVVTGVIDRNSDLGVTWVQSFVSADREKTFCVYDAPTPEAIRRAAEHNGLPVDGITQVTVLDPYFYTAGLS